MRTSKFRRSNSSSTNRSRAFLNRKGGGTFFQQRERGATSFISPSHSAQTVLQRFPEEDTQRRGDPPSYRESLDITTGPNPIEFNINLSPPSARPEPRFNRTSAQLGAWEKVTLNYSPVASFDTQTTENGESFVTLVTFGIQNPWYSYHIANEVYEGRTYGNARNVWMRIYLAINQHSREHFNRFETTLRAFNEEARGHFDNLPGRYNPSAISEQELANHLDRLLRYLHARLHFLLWQTTCAWERADYPRLFRGLPSISARVPLFCQTPPSVPPVPILATSVVAPTEQR